MEPFGESAAFTESSGKLIDDDDLTVLYHIVNIFFEEVVCFERLIEVVGKRGIFQRVEVVHFEEILCLLQSLFGHDNGTVFLINDKITGHHLVFTRLGRQLFASLHLLGDLVGFGIVVVVTLGWPGDDQRCPCLIDENGVDFIDDGVVVLTLYLLIKTDFHVVTQVVEAVFVVGTVGDVGIVLSLSLLLVIDVRGDTADAVTEELVEYPHLFGVTLGKIVVDGDDVYPFACHGIEYDSKGGDEGFSLTGLHLGDVAVMQYHTPDHLHVIVAQTKRSFACFTGDGKGVVEDIIEGFLTTVYLLSERIERRLKFFVAHRLIGAFKCIDLLHSFHVVFNDTVILCTDHFLKQTFDHFFSCLMLNSDYSI